MEILQNCSYEKAAKDDIIVKQGEKGDKSVHTNPREINVCQSDDVYNFPIGRWGRGYQRMERKVKAKHLVSCRETSAPISLTKSSRL